jgi:hypothetical protein
VTASSAAPHVTPPVVYSSLGLQFRVVADDADLADEFAYLYASCGVAAPPAAPVRVLELRAADRPASARFDGGPALFAADRNGLLLGAMALVDGAAVDASAEKLLVIHASAVMTDSGPVLLVGPSGAGKSTLAAALAMHGLAYIGDEALGLTDASAGLIGNPKPLKLDGRSRCALFAGAADDLASRDPASEILLAPHALGPVVAPGEIAAPVAVVQIAYRAGARSGVTPMSRADVAEALADQCFNFARWGARGLDTVVALARTAAGLRLDFGDLDGGLALLRKALG